MNVAHFYHVWADGQWREPVLEHLDALDRAAFDGPLTVGVVGHWRHRAEALTAITARRHIDVTFTADHGYEQVTLHEVLIWAATTPGAVLYAHTKGAHDPSDFRVRWRRSMTAQLVERWREHADRLELGDVDAIGCHWLTSEQFPGIVADTPFPMFGGNFWLATCDYLRRLPAPDQTDRYQAEAWIGLGQPRVIDVTPGWPGDDTFAQAA